MIKYIVDTSIMMQYLLSEPHTANVSTLFEHVAKSTTTVYVPEFCLLECTNVLWKHVRFQGMPQNTADLLTQDLLALDLILVAVTNMLPRALEIGLKHELAVYDSLYIALAEKLGYPLITVDVKQEKAALAEGITLKPITEFTA
ncbi:MAG: type II toxin-antitoxin system VapC family toxin [Aggregatilineales bacterium]